MTSLAPSPARLRRPSWATDRTVLRTEVLAGLVVALALIPEAISFSILAGVDPRVGLFASFTMAVTIAFTGGRPAMISAATGAIALVVAPLAREYGLGYLVAAVVLGGVLPDRARGLGRRAAHALPPAQRHGRLRQRAGDPHLHRPAAAPDRRAAGSSTRWSRSGLAIIYGLPRLTSAVPVAAGRDRRPHHPDGDRRDRGADRRRRGRAARTACRCSACPTSRSPSRRCGSSPPTRWRWPSSG